MTRHLDNNCIVEGCDNACWKEVCAKCALKMRQGTIPPAGGVKPNPPCEIPGCEIPSYSRVTPLCRGHHEFANKNGDPKRKREKVQNGKPKRPCSREGCEEPRQSRMLCARHYSENRYQRVTQKCAQAGCERNTALEMCAVHSKQVEKYGFSWVGSRPTEKIREWRESQRPKCRVRECTEVSSSDESLLCRKHRGDWGRKGCTLEFYLELQTHTKCEACGLEGVPLVTDHDHSHDWKHGDRKDYMCQECIRGRLCGGCNSALGHAGEDPDRLRALAQYIERFK